MLNEFHLRFIEEARKCLGTPYGHIGRKRGVAMDCSGLVMVALKEAGYRIDSVTSYGKDPECNWFEQHLNRQVLPVDGDPHANVSAGRIGFFWYGHRNVGQHIGVLTGTSLIHSWADSGKVVEHDYPDIFWQRRLIKVYEVDERRIQW